jgi:aquaporin Z
MKKYVAEVIGTFTLVFFGCATAIFMGDKVGLLGIAIAFGLTVVAMAYSIGHISGAHLNPAVSVGAFVAGRMNASDLVGYIVSQVIGGIIAAAILYVMVKGDPTYDIAVKGFATSAPGSFGVTSALIYEVIATAIFLTVILGVTQSGTQTTAFAGLVIGLTLTLLHLGGITVSGSSVNPARSIGPALFAGGPALSVLWLYIVGPIAGGIIGGLLFRSGVTKAD